MIERVARAQERLRNPQWSEEEFEVWWTRDPFFCERVTGWSHFRGTQKEKCLFEARAAIEAMRIATGPMTAAGIKRDVEWRHNKAPREHGYPAAREQAVFTAMIDAALTETKT